MTLFGEAFALHFIETNCWQKPQDVLHPIILRSNRPNENTNRDVTENSRR